MLRSLTNRYWCPSIKEQLMASFPNQTVKLKKENDGIHVICPECKADLLAISAIGDCPKCKSSIEISLASKYETTNDKDYLQSNIHDGMMLFSCTSCKCELHSSKGSTVCPKCNSNITVTF